MKEIKVLHNREVVMYEGDYFVIEGDEKRYNNDKVVIQLRQLHNGEKSFINIKDAKQID